MLEKRTNISCMILHPKETSVITIWDGIYIYTHKSSNNAFQRSCYSMHKQRHLIKPMVCVAPNGYIIDIIGPFKATENDASIMKTIMKNMPEVRSRFYNDDVFVVDRGFRDVKQYLERERFVVKIPYIIPPGESQLSDVIANRSRLITKIKFIVEAINGHLKTCFRYFDYVWCIQSTPHLMIDFRNAAALHNIFYSAIISDVEHSEEIAQLMLNRLHKPNLLFRLVHEQHLNRKTTAFVSLNAHELEGFPVLTKDDLYRISLGLYQIK